ncbi:MAG: hypothetical protein WD271_14220 [Acidimicrobiia bacterium]
MAATEAGHQRVATVAAGTAAYALGLQARFDDADALFVRSVELAEQDANSYRLAWSRAQRGVILGLSGRLADAFTSLELALDTSVWAPDALAFEDLVQCCWLAGRLETGLAWLERSLVRRTLHGSRRRAWALAIGARISGAGQPRSRPARRRGRHV